MASKSSSSELYIIVGGSERRIGGIWFAPKLLLLFAEATGVTVEGDGDEDCESDSDITADEIHLLQYDSFSEMVVYGSTPRAGVIL